VLGLRDVPQLRNCSVGAARRVQQAQRRKTVSFRVADVHLALPMGAIQEIIRVPALHPSPLAGEVCVGMLNLRGSIVPVVDFARLIGAGASIAAPSLEAAADERRIVVLKQQEMHFGLLVDEVCSIVGYRDDELLPMPAYSQRQAALFAGCLIQDEAANIILLKPEALYADGRIAAMADGHRDLYRAGRPAVATSVRARTSGTRATYVTFRLEHLYGVPIDQLREVIDYPDAIVRAPGLPSYVLGVLNLRRELITVIDVRSLYAMPAHPDLARAKVLVVEHHDEKYGLVVDALDNIVTIDAADRIGVPAILMQQAANGLLSSLKEAVELPGRGTLMLLDVATLCAHVAAKEPA
jgi:purine-binding chemotaxis protein CheW